MTKEECEIETSKAIMEMRSRIEELEQKNAELKEQIEHYRKEREFFIGEVEKNDRFKKL